MPYPHAFVSVNTFTFGGRQLAIQTPAAQTTLRINIFGVVLLASPAIRRMGTGLALRLSALPPAKKRSQLWGRGVTRLIMN